jgi:formate-dependent nitrite reductase membrane component NrfD
MLPIKWKAFRMVIYLHLASTTILGAYTLLRTFESISSYTRSEDIWGIIIVIVCTSILLGNSSVSLYLLEKYYPTQLPGNGLYRASRTLGFFAWIVALLYAVGSGYGFYQLTKYDFWQNNMQGVLVFFAMGVISLSGFYLLWNQVSLRKIIRRNHEASINSFLEEDQP